MYIKFVFQGCVSMPKYVYVPRVHKYLNRLALAVSAGEPVLLQGPVGCGKTSIIEHLAALTGRKPYEELLKVQLGDHMDSKVWNKVFVEDISGLPHTYF